MSALALSGARTAQADTCPGTATTTCSAGGTPVCTYDTSHGNQIICWLAVDGSGGDATATAIGGDCGSTDVYCIWGHTAKLPGGTPYCCSFSQTNIEKVVINGGPHDDTISFQYGDDNLDNFNTDMDPTLQGIAMGSSGEDNILGSRATDAPYYVDYLHGGTDGDVIYGDDGDDFIYGDEDSDHLRGGAGDDVISGGEGQDFISGGDDSDQIHGDGDGDVICGDGGGRSGKSEVINGDAGTANTLWGGSTSYEIINGDPTDYDYCGSYSSQSDCNDITTLTTRPASCPAP